MTIRERPGEFLEQIAAAGHQHEIVAVVCEQIGEISADAARRAGDNGNWPGFASASRGDVCGW
jgi:hypothetical protein